MAIRLKYFTKIFASLYPPCWVLRHKVLFLGNRTSSLVPRNYPTLDWYILQLFIITIQLHFYWNNRPRESHSDHTVELYALGWHIVDETTSDPQPIRDPDSFPMVDLGCGKPWLSAGMMPPVSLFPPVYPPSHWHGQGGVPAPCSGTCVTLHSLCYSCGTWPFFFLLPHYVCSSPVSCTGLRLKTRFYLLALYFLGIIELKTRFYLPLSLLFPILWRTPILWSTFVGK